MGETIPISECTYKTPQQNLIDSWSQGGGEYNHIEIHLKWTGNNNPYIQDIDLVDMRQAY